MIRPVTKADAAAICDIYNHYIDHTVISFEYDRVSIEIMQQRIENTTAKYPWLVYEEQGAIIAYAYANLWKEREAYKHVLETTVYASHTMTTKGVGTKLYQALFGLLIDNYQSTIQIKSLMGVIALPNDASVALHKKLGFVEAGYFKKVGYKFDQWVDVAYYQKDL
jgi:L-amino acid N-acyltransferase YncA